MTAANSKRNKVHSSVEVLAAGLLLIMGVMAVALVSSRAHASGTSASDTFSRTVSAGWGAADTGGAYTLIGSSADFNINGTQGVITMNGTGSANQRTARLDSVSASNVDETLRIMFTSLPTSTAHIVYIIGRHASGNNEYRGRVRVDSAGVVHLQASVLAAGTETLLGTEVSVSGFKVVANGFFDVHFQLSGSNPTTLNLRSWADGTGEPGTWNYSTTDGTLAVQNTGSVGILSRAGSNVPVNFVYDDFLVTNSDGAFPTPTSTATRTRIPTATPVPPTATPVSSDPVIAAAGDIACGSTSVGGACQQQSTANLINSINPSAVLPLGDTQYEQGALTDFNSFYDPSWGSFKGITDPSVGNHEYLTTNAQGYFDYYNGVGVQTGPAGNRSQGYYSFNLGNWHLIALNGNCGKISGGCSAGSPQEKWLKSDLAANPGKCILAYNHFPMFSSGQQPHNSGINPLFLDLYNAHADLFLVGHDHDYERFVPSNPSGAPDPNGVTEIVAGTGGRNLTSLGSNGLAANSVIFNSTTFGVLKLTLHASSYDWVFIPSVSTGSFRNGTFTDSGTASCHTGG